MHSSSRSIRERGQSSAAYAGVIVVVVVVVLALLAYATPIGQRLACGIATSISKVFGNEGDVCGAGSNQSDPYKVDESTIVKDAHEEGRSTGAAVRVDGKVGYASLEATDASIYNEDSYYGGQKLRTLENRQQVSLSGGFGTEVKQNNNASSVSVNVDASAALKVTHGQKRGWFCDGPSASRECSTWDAQNAQNIEEQQRYLAFARGLKHKDISDRPDLDVDVWQAELAVNAGAGANAGYSASKDVKGEAKVETKANAEAKADIKGNVLYRKEEIKDNRKKDGENKTFSHTFQYSGEAQAKVEVDASVDVEKKNPKGDATFGLSGSANAEAYGKYTGTYNFTTDENGNLKTITFIGSKEGRASAEAEAKIKAMGHEASVKTDGDKPIVRSTVTSTLDVDSLSPEERKVAEEYVRSSWSNGALIVPQSSLNPDRPSDNKFDNLLHDKAKVHRVQQEVRKDERENSDWGPFAQNFETSERSKTVNVEELGKPGADGVRSYQNKDVH